MNADFLAMLVAAVLGSGGGSWVVVRVHLHYLREGVAEAKASASRAHQRIDAMRKA